MKVVFDELYSLYQNDPALVAAIPQLYFVVAKQATRASQITYPHGVWQPISHVADHMSFTEDEESFLFQISVYARDPNELQTALEAFIGTVSPTTGFDNATLSPAGFEPTKLDRESVIYRHDSENDVYIMTITYSIVFEKTNTDRN
jgi:hypothetical protein